MEHYYPMESLTKNNELYSFDVTGVPVNLDKEHFVLLANNDTPILKQGYYKRGCDIPGIYEGDIILYRGVEYVFYYQRGFILLSRKRNRKFLWELDSFEVIGNTLNIEWPFNVPCPKSIYYSFEGKDIYPNSFIGYADNKIIIEGFSVKIDPHRLQQDACFTYERQKIHFGDLINGYPVELYYGRPVIKYDNVIYDVIYKKYIERRK